MSTASEVIVVLGLAALAASVAWADEVTLVSSFEQPEEVERLAGVSGIEQVVGLTSHGLASAAVTFTSDEKSLDLSALLPTDWRGYDRLRIDVLNPGRACLFTLRVDDALYDPQDPAERHTISSWYHRARTGSSTLEFILPGFAEDADLSQVKSVLLRYESPLTRPHSVAIDNLRFVRGRGLMVHEPPELPVTRPVTEVADNFIPNGNFELGLQNWGSWGRWEGGRYRFDCGFGVNAYEGESSAAVICDVPGRGGIYTGVLQDVRPGLYRLSYSVKPSDGAVARVLLTGASGNADRTIAGLPADWSTFTYNVTVPEGAEDLRLYIFNVGTGALFADAVSLVSVTGTVQPRSAVSRVTQSPARVEIRKNVVYLEGEPFFPVGIYQCNDPAVLEGTGFNLCMGHELMATPAQLLDACDQARVMTMFNLTGLMRGHRPEKVAEAVRDVKNHPAVLAWYVCDEPDSGAWNVPPDEVALATQVLHRTTKQPTTSVVMAWTESNLYRYQGALDILATDIYPIRGGGQPSDLTKVAVATDVAKRATGGSKPVWIVLQGTPEASAEEEYGVTYLAVTHGADGILYFAYSDELRQSEAWEALVDISLELQELSPYLTSPTSDKEVAVSDERVHVMLKESPKVYCLITVNSSSEPLEEVTFALPFLREGVPFIVPFEARGGEAEGGTITDRFGPYQRHVYVIQK